MAKIKVHEKALAHLSRGLYRSPASALRELVSNAWDANATVVRITTNYPSFYQLAVEDNGTGFTRQEFEGMMEGGVGNSQKRPLGASPINNRPIIGRLGIGMLGIAQICMGFKIISRPRTGQGFSARIRLYDLLKESLDRDDPTVTREKEGTREVDVGEYDIEEFDLTDVRFGTTILADDVHPMFVKAFQESVNFEGFVPPQNDWSKVLEVVSSVRSLQELGDYWRLIWELAACCPVPYISETAVPKKLISEDQKTLQTYDFAIVVDGIELHKPVRLHGNPGGYTTFRIDRQHKKVYDKDLIFHGYIVVQEGSQLRPDELRGILLRIKNVAIGYYDPSFLDYRINQGPRSRWLTGEVFIDEGLEDALNIDRDSFNRFHPEFREIQGYIHKVLNDKIFPEVYRQIEKRSADRAVQKERGHTLALKDAVSEVTNLPVQIRSQRQSPEEPVVTVTDRATALDLLLQPPEYIKTRKPNRHLALAVLAIYEVANREKNRDKQRQVFTELLLKLLARW